MKGPIRQILDDHDRRIAGILRMGTIEEVDYAHTEDGATRPRLRVRSGDIVTGWLPWPAHLGRNRVDWTPLKKGQQVLIGAPSGDVTQTVVIGLLYVDGDPPPSTDPEKDVIHFRSGTVITHDAETGDLDIECAGNVNVNAAGEVNVTAPHVNLN